MLQIGAFVQNRQALHWGVGVVQSLNSVYCEVTFSHGTVKLVARIAAQVLEVVTPQNDERVKLTHTKTQDRTTCTCCDQALRKSLFTEDRRWKSCPNCS